MAGRDIAVFRIPLAIRVKLILVDPFLIWRILSHVGHMLVWWDGGPICSRGVSCVGFTWRPGAGCVSFWWMGFLGFGPRSITFSLVCFCREYVVWLGMFFGGGGLF